MDAAAKADLKSRIVAARGYWARFHDVLLERDPGFLEAYLAFQSAPTQGVLSQKLCEFIYIAIDMSVNHMYERGGRRHMEYALKAGATPDEVLQVVLLTTVVSAHHPIDLGLDILAEIEGEARADGDDAYRRKVGGDLADSYDAYARAVWERGPLDALDRQMIALALCAAPTCLHRDGMRQHMKAALEAGATRRQVYAVLQLAAALSIHTCTIAIPGFDDVLAGEFVE
jgi:alkylhydroperoxidase/carboxymuconolactone decarboxylase family protein YurZ